MLKTTAKKMKNQATNLEKTFAENVSDQETVSRIYREVLLLNNKSYNCILKMNKRCEQTVHHIQKNAHSKRQCEDA